MRYFLVLGCILISFSLLAQVETSEEEVFAVVGEMPLFPGCADTTLSLPELKKCSDKKMLEFVYANVEYPNIDREKGNEGTAVVQFIVEKDGSISNPKIVRDPGDQLGEETVRVVEMMNFLPQKWTPGKQDGKAVRVYMNLPVKFKIQEIKEPDYVLNGTDSIWVKFDQALEFKGKDEALNEYIEKNLEYPIEGQDSCRIGIVELNILVNGDGTIKILDVADYSDLGIDYQFEAIRVINSSFGNWIPATYGGRNVNASKSIRITFKPNMVSCGSVVYDFEKADALVDEAAILIQKESTEEGIAKLTEALDMFPDNGEYLSMRGQAYLKLQKTVEACVDMKKAQKIMITTFFDDLIPLLCR